MKRLLGWVQALPAIALLVGGIWAYTWLAEHRGRDKAFIEETRRQLTTTYKANQQLAVLVAKLRKEAMKNLASANAHKAQQDAILQKHPIATSPEACRPWTIALTQCQLEARDLRLAVNGLTVALDTTARARAKADSLLAKADTALGQVGCSFPCLKVGPGIGIDEGLKVRKGIFGIISF